METITRPDDALWAQHRAARRTDDWSRWPECRGHDAAVTCISCGAVYGQPHNPGCEFS